MAKQIGLQRFGSLSSDLEFIAQNLCFLLLATPLRTPIAEGTFFPPVDTFCRSSRSAGCLQTNVTAALRQWEPLNHTPPWQALSGYLAISLRGPAMGVLSNLNSEQCLDYKALSTALDIQFREAHQVELSHVQLRSRLCRWDESLPELAENIEHLTQLAYPNTPRTSLLMPFTMKKYSWR